MGKPVFIELDTQRELRFGTNVFIKIEDQLGVSLSALDTDKLSYRQARTLLFVPLHEQDKTLTPELVGNMIDKAGINYCMEKVSEAIKSAIEVEESAKKLEIGGIEEYYTLSEFMDKAKPLVALYTSISPEQLGNMTPAEIYNLLNEISLMKQRDFNFEKDKLESIVKAVTLGIINTRKKGKPYTLFEKSEDESTRTISQNDKKNELDYLKKVGGF